MYYPVFLNIKDKKCVVVGGGQVALRKVKSLLECGAKVTVISSDICAELETLAVGTALILTRRNYRLGDLKGASVAYAATNDLKVNHRVAEEGKREFVLVNVVDNAAESDFIVPSYFSRGDITLAVSTSGKSPALARKIRSTLEKDFGNEFAELALLINDVRSNLKQKNVRFEGDTWQQALDIDSLLKLIKTGRKDDARKMLLNGLFSHTVDNGANK